MKKEISNELLQRYLQDECTPEEEALVDEWYASFDNQENDKRLLNMLERRILEKKMLQRIKATLAGAEVHSGENPQAEVITSKKVTLGFFYKAAAVIVFAIAFGLGAYLILWTPDKTEAYAELIKVTNANNTISRQALADGTVLWLQPNSQIEYPAEFSRTSREMTLTGEAFFDVAPDANRPFIITTGKVTTRVLGTSFNIKAYDHAESIEVSVMTGKVSVALTNSVPGIKDPNTVLLTPQQRVTYLKTENRLERNNEGTLPELNIWTPLDIIFENVKMQEVILTLEKKFGVTIQTENPNLSNCIIRADFTNQNLPDILEMLSKSVEATYEIRDNTILLKGEGCIN